MKTLAALNLRLPGADTEARTERWTVGRYHPTIEGCS
jgi:hypothetical protein